MCEFDRVRCTKACYEEMIKTLQDRLDELEEASEVTSCD